MSISEVLPEYWLFWSLRLSIYAYELKGAIGVWQLDNTINKMICVASKIKEDIKPKDS